jgi:hypothetical protein
VPAPNKIIITVSTSIFVVILFSLHELRSATLPDQRVLNLDKGILNCKGSYSACDEAVTTDAKPVTKSSRIYQRAIYQP